MNKVLCTIVCLLAVGTVAQTEEAAAGAGTGESNDASVVRSILDKNSLVAIQVDQVATFSEGRVIRLDLDNREVGQQGLTILPPEIGQLTELRELTLNDNDLVTLPDEIGRLTKLRNLEIRSNSLISIPSTIGNMTPLHELDLRNNDITTLPIEIGLLGRLWKLQLWGNNLRSLPPTMGSLRALRELYLRGNRLQTLPMGMLKLKLDYIDVQENRLCNPPGAIDNWLKKFDKRYRSWQKCW